MVDLERIFKRIEIVINDLEDVCEKEGTGIDTIGILKSDVLMLERIKELLMK